mmetsp:Transcript_534/g.1355  ORF Transcript_534/g.1355 Transcript_534/m.1355 type:complete len:94 (+) Transcript_534:576-857(+)
MPTPETEPAKSVLPPTPSLPCCASAAASSVQPVVDERPDADDAAEERERSSESTDGCVEFVLDCVNRLFVSVVLLGRRAGIGILARVARRSAH